MDFKYCFGPLIESVKNKGTCSVKGNPANNPELDVWGNKIGSCQCEKADCETDDCECDAASHTIYFDIVTGTCDKDSCGSRLYEMKCTTLLKQQPSLIQLTIVNLLRYTTSTDVHRCIFCSINSFRSARCIELKVTEQFCNGVFNIPRRRKRSSVRLHQTRLAPVSNIDGEIHTELNFNNTRHRYPWICSLRTRGVTAEHICAVTILSLPPQPTIIIGPAHCTYLCKDGGPNGARLEACCCTPQPNGCSEDPIRCEKNPGAVEMDPKEMKILCGEWETGPSPRRFSNEKYNVGLEIKEIVRHPDFLPAVGVDGGSDIAVFKIHGEEEVAWSSKPINPICLPDPGRPVATEGVQSGWSNPPPLYYFSQFGSGFLDFIQDTFKQWHYKLNIESTCEEPRKSTFASQVIKYPSKAYYPPGLICAKDATLKFCPTAGDSGSPLMVRDSQRAAESNGERRYYIEGILSFLKSCERFRMTAETDNQFTFDSFTESPIAYTKISCFLPWVAEQFGLSYSAAQDDACIVGTGEKPPFNSTHDYDSTCRVTLASEHSGSELKCIFPFYLGDKLYNTCALFSTVNLAVPLWMCPTKNISTKYPGTDINHFPDVDLRETYYLDASCPDGAQDFNDCQALYRPEWTSENQIVTNVRYYPFETCKTDCPGGKYIRCSKYWTILVILSQ